MKRYNTPKLFYSTYPYKFVCYNDIATEFRESKLSNVRDALDSLQHQWDSNEDLEFGHEWSTRKRKVSRASFFDAKILYNELKKRSSYRLRVEHRKLAIYSTKKDWLEKLAQNINQAVEFWEPNNELLEPGYVYLKTNYGFDYRITLKGRINVEQANWIANNQHILKVGRVFTKNIKDGDLWVEGYYLYVKSEGSLVLAQMVLNSRIRRIDKVIYKDKNA